jgi:hypothetical protein
MQMIEDLVDRARRRLILNESLGLIVSAAAFACGGLALILLLGTRYFEWWTIAIPAGLALAAGGFRIWRRFPTGYAIAQKLDRSAGLPDLLSTAIHFRNHPVHNPQFRDGQQAQAESAARQLDLAAAIPYRFPRAFYPLAALTLLASGLVVLRYSLTRSLDLRAPLTEVLFEDQLAHQHAPRQSPAAAKSFKALKAAESLMARLNMANSPDQRQEPDALDQAIDQALAPPSQGNPGQGDKAGNAGKNGQQKNANGLEQGKNGDPLDGKEGANSSPNSDGKSPDSQQNGAPSDKNTNSSASDSNSSSLLSKLKDAVSNMFSRSRQDGGQNQKGAQQNAQMAKADRQNSERNSGGKGQNEGQAQTDAQEGDPNGDPQQGEQAQGKNGTKTSVQNSAQAGSGIGSQDGAKDLRAAAQLKAMGRISEIIGKRAATVTGETMVEVQSGNQQLRTAYSEKSATHGDANSDLNRDEIPPALQTYVANYFEQVRKSSSKASGANPAR